MKSREDTGHNDKQHPGPHYSWPELWTKFARNAKVSEKTEMVNWHQSSIIQKKLRKIYSSILKTWSSRNFFKHARRKIKKHRAQVLTRFWPFAKNLADDRSSHAHLMSLTSHRRKHERTSARLVTSRTISSSDTRWLAPRITVTCGMTSVVDVERFLCCDDFRRYRFACCGPTQRPLLRQKWSNTRPQHLLSLMLHEFLWSSTCLPHQSTSHPHR